MGGLHLYKWDEPWRPLDVDMVSRLIRECKLELPTDEEIHDRSKSNILVNALVFMQTSWFLIDYITRSAQSLPLTKPDIVAFSYILIALSTYIALWDKPRNVLHPIRVPQTKAKLTDEDFPFDLLRNRVTSVFMLHKLTIRQVFDILCGFPDDVFLLEGSEKVPRFYAGGWNSRHDMESIIMGIIMGMASAGICCIAWSLGTRELHIAEVLLWRLFSLSFVLVVLLVVTLPITAVSEWFKRRMRLVTTCTISFYVICRIGILILALISLRSLPFTAYETVYWAELIPHF